MAPLQASKQRDTSRPMTPRPMTPPSLTPRPMTPRSASAPDTPHRAVADLQSARGAQRRSTRAAHPAPELLRIFTEMSFEQHFQPNSTVLLHGAPADAIYLVRSGTVRCCTIDDDGSRQIFSFAKKGDFIGLSDIEDWHFTAEAVDHVVLSAVPRDIVERHLRVNIALRQEFRTHITQLLRRREKQLLALISQKAPDRLFHFLVEFAASRPGAGSAPVALPMCRRDIADHLGLSVETVSRAFSDLKRKGRIDLVTCEKYRILPTQAPTPLHRLERCTA